MTNAIIDEETDNVGNLMKIETYHVLLQNWDILYFICNEFTTSATTRTSTTNEQCLVEYNS